MSTPTVQDRYATTLATKQLPNGRVVYVSLRPLSIKPKPLTDNTLTATDAVRMDKVANDIYRSPLNWWRIASANGLVNGSLFFRDGTTIVIPS